MNSADDAIVPSWKWATAEGSRDLDRLLDRRLTFREKVEWLEHAETLSLRLEASRRNASAESVQPGKCPAQRNQELPSEAGATAPPPV
jgi:hypothetical protein